MSRTLTAAVLLLTVSSCGPAGAPERPHVVLVTVDTLRADHLSLHGYPRETSPNIDRFARTALHYTNAITVVPKTGPSLATHMSGLPPSEHQVVTNKLRIPDQVPVLAERLKAVGYRTVAFVSNPVLSAAKGFGRGFHLYRGFQMEGGPEYTNQRFLRWARKKPWSQPTFAWIHYVDPHGPYEPPEEFADLFAGDELYDEETHRFSNSYDLLAGWHDAYRPGAIPSYQIREFEDRAAAYLAWYDAEIRYTDRMFAEVLDFLREQGLLEHTAVVFTADHGESLGEHGYWFEHGWYAYDATLRVPLIIKPPGDPAPARIDSQVSNLDTLPTLLAIAGIEPPAGLAGTSLLSDPGDRGPLLVQNTGGYPDRFVGVRVAERKLIRNESTGHEELYDLLEDPREERNLLAAHPLAAERMREALDAALEARRGRALGETYEVLPTPAEAVRLEALGYAGDG